MPKRRTHNKEMSQEYKRLARLLGRGIRRAIKQSPYTLKAACRELDIAEQTMQNYVTGRTAPDALVLYGMCKLCKVSMDSLFSGSGEDTAAHTELRTIKRMVQEMRETLDFLCKRGKIQ